ncbi:MAG: tRNA (adenosine(37)-N6)-dimethylallyltransferase MiaA [Clostridia bacterium]|nr:tRNA (adenosine(37)-N6)-dimethylallyltransferase MiaA [Clostridia bacterium]
MVQENSLNKIIVVCGPTGSGKSSLAVELALKYGGEVVSADSVAIYKQLDIGSAKPTKEDMKGVTHHLIDVVTPFDEFSVSDYEKMALSVIEDIISRGKLPIICGGTGFYVNSILYKMSYGKAKGDLAVRSKYQQLAKEKGNQAVFDILIEKDPETAKILHVNDLVRVIRALEIVESSGIKKSDIVDEKIPRFDFIAITTDMNRATLYDRINRRVDLMIENGIENEVKNLLEQGVTIENQCMQGIGYKEVVESTSSGSEFPAEQIKMNSRRYAKRQITFFKRYENLIKYNPLIDGEFEKLCKIIDNFLNN